MNRTAPLALLLAILLATPLTAAIVPTMPRSTPPDMRPYLAAGPVHFSYTQGPGCDAAYAMTLWQEWDGTWSYDVVTTAWPLCNALLLYRTGGVGDLETGITWYDEGACGESTVTMRLDSPATARYREDANAYKCMDSRVIVEGTLAITPGTPP